MRQDYQHWRATLRLRPEFGPTHRHPLVLELHMSLQPEGDTRKRAASRAIEGRKRMYELVRVWQEDAP